MTDAPLPEQRPIQRGGSVLAVVLLAVLVVSMDNSILNVALKTLAESPPTGLAASQSQLQWATDAYTLVYAGLLLSGGVAGNRLGHKRMLLIGLACFAVFSALSAFAGRPGELIGYRAAMGLSAAIIMPATLAIITNIFPGQARAKAIGIWSAVVGAAVALGPIVAGALLEHFWWGSVFLINVPVVAVALVAILLLTPELRVPERRSLDPMGIALSTVGLLAIVYGVIRAGDIGRWTTSEVYLPVVAGLVLITAFVLWERRSPSPVLDMRFFANRGFTASAVALTSLFMALLGGTFVMTFYLQTIRGYSALQAGLCVLPLAAAMIVFAPRAPKLVRKFGGRAVGVGGMLAVGVALAGLATIGVSTPVWVFEVLLFVFGAGMAHVIPPSTAQILATLPQGQAGTSSAVNNTFRQVGGSIGIAVLGSLMSSVYRGRIGPDLAVLPPAARAAAQSSVTATFRVLQSAGAVGQGLVPRADDAFVYAMRITWATAAAVVFVGAVVVFVLYPRRTRVAAEAAALPPASAVEARPAGLGGG